MMDKREEVRIKLYAKELQRLSRST